MSIHRGGLYARVSTTDQHCEAQLIALRRYATAREWPTTEYVDHGVSGSKEQRPALDLMLTAAWRRELAVVVVTKLDRLARSSPAFTTRRITARGLADRSAAPEGSSTSMRSCAGGPLGSRGEGSRGP